MAQLDPPDAAVLGAGEAPHKARVQLGRVRGCRSAQDDGHRAVQPDGGEPVEDLAHLRLQAVVQHVLRPRPETQAPRFHFDRDAIEQVARLRLPAEPEDLAVGTAECHGAVGGAVAVGVANAASHQSRQGSALHVALRVFVAPLHAWRERCSLGARSLVLHLVWCCLLDSHAWLM